MISQILEIPNDLNYLNRGDSLEHISDLRLLPMTGLASRREVRERIQVSKSKGFQEVIGDYGSLRSSRINIDSLHKDFNKSLKMRTFFSKIKCKGFSYYLDSNLNCNYERLREDINIRIALFPKEDFFYPRHLKRHLRKVRFNHFRSGGYESIAFAFAKIENRNCQVLALQSDIIRRRVAYVKDHFRGWRKVLFMLLVNLVQNQTETVSLFRASDIAKACHANSKPSARQVGVWESIYDKTAEDFGLEPRRLDYSSNLQLYADQPKYATNVAYCATIDSVLRRFCYERYQD